MAIPSEKGQEWKGHMCPVGGGPLLRHLVGLVQRALGRPDARVVMESMVPGTPLHPLLIRVHLVLKLCAFLSLSSL